MLLYGCYVGPRTVLPTLIIHHLMQPLSQQFHLAFEFAHSRNSADFFLIPHTVQLIDIASEANFGERHSFKHTERFSHVFYHQSMSAHLVPQKINLPRLSLLIEFISSQHPTYYYQSKQKK